jgi:hypothetical protein
MISSHAVNLKIGEGAGNFLYTVQFPKEKAGGYWHFPPIFLRRKRYEVIQKGPVLYTGCLIA